MQESVVLREYEASDAPYLEDIIRKTWHYDEFCSPKTARRLAKIYLLSCLSRQTYIRVAVQKDMPVGVIMGRDRRLKPARRFQAHLAWAEVQLLCHREGRFVAKAFAGIDQVDEALLAARGKDYDGELSFFVVHDDFRGQGIGKALFDALLGYMKKQDIQRFYLYTDSSCNYTFYERRGMKRCGEKDYAVPIGRDNAMQFYLYDYEVEGA